MAKVLFQSRVEIVLHLQGISQSHENRTPFLAQSVGFSDSKGSSLRRENILIDRTERHLKTDGV